MKIVVGHLYPDYLNIYADRGNIAVLSRRAAWRGHELDVRSVSVGEPLHSGEHDLLYVGGGQDREQALVAQDLVAKADGVRESVAGGVALLAAGRAAASGARSGRTSTAHSCRGTPGLPTGCSRRRSRIATARRRGCSPSRMTSRPRRMRCQLAAQRLAAADGAEPT